jgi:hypothetical protein
MHKTLGLIPQHQIVVKIIIIVTVTYARKAFLTSLNPGILRIAQFIFLSLLTAAVPNLCHFLRDVGAF